MADLSAVSGTRKLLAVAITAVALFAICLSSYLTWATWQQSTVAGCTGSSAAGCDEVLSSAGSKWLGVPVSLFGVLTYVGILALVWPAVIFGGWAMTLLLAIALLAAGSGVWFTGTQALVVQHFCFYCMTIHTCGLLICIATIFLMRADAGAPNYDHMRAYFGGENQVDEEPSTIDAFQPLIAAGIAAVGLLALIGGQVFFSPSGMEVVEDVPMQAAEESTETSEQGTEQIAMDGPADGSTKPVEPAEEPVVASDQEEQGTAWVTDSLEFSAEADQVSGERLDQVDDDAKDDVTFDLFDEPAADSLNEGSAETAEADPALNTDAVGAESEFDESLFSSDTKASQVQDTAKPVLIDVPDVPRYFRFKYLRREIDVMSHPVIGNPYAPHRMVEMLDYTCPHCRKLHLFIQKAVERYGDQIGFVVYHVPLSRKCNPMVKVDQASHRNACEYAKLAYGVWKISPNKFAEYHDWLMKGEKAPSVYDAKTKAMALVGDAILMDNSIEAEAAKRAADAAAELEPLKVGLPVLIFEQGRISGLPDSEQEWFQVLESRLGVTSVASVTN